MPAAAVTRGVRALSGFTGRKVYRRRLSKSHFKDRGLTSEMGAILEKWSGFGEAGIPGGGVKSVDIRKNTKGEGKLLGTY